MTESRTKGATTRGTVLLLGLGLCACDAQPSESSAPTPSDPTVTSPPTKPAAAEVPAHSRKQAELAAGIKARETSDLASVRPAMEEGWVTCAQDSECALVLSPCSPDAMAVNTESRSAAEKAWEQECEGVTPIAALWSPPPGALCSAAKCVAAEQPSRAQDLEDLFKANSAASPP